MYKGGAKWEIAYGGVALSGEVGATKVVIGNRRKDVLCRRWVQKRGTRTDYIGVSAIVF